MGFKKSLRQDGMIHAQTYSAYQKREVKKGRKPNQNKIDICLNCTKEECKGTKNCFKKAVKAQESGIANG